MKGFDLIVAENIKKKLAETQKKQTDLANFLGFPRQTVNKILNGKRNITATELNRVAEFFCCSIGDLTKNSSVDCSVKAFFMGNISNPETQERINIVYDLSKIIAEQQYASMDK